VYNVFKDDEDGLERAVRAALDAPILDRCVALPSAIVISPHAPTC
jgi:hypothetical protein